MDMESALSRFLKGKDLALYDKTSGLEGFGSFVTSATLGRAVNIFKCAKFDATEGEKTLDRALAIGLAVISAPLYGAGIILREIGTLFRSQEKANQTSLQPQTQQEIEAHQKLMDALYEAYAILDRELRENNIPYCLVAGSALGAERHGGIIPWDDDGDVGINACDREKVAALTKELEKNPRVKLAYDSVGDKFALTFTARDGTVASIDLFVMSQAKVKQKDGTEKSYMVYSKIFRTNFPNEFIECESISGEITERKSFGPKTSDSNKPGLELPVLKDNKAYLSRAYGKNWQSQGIKTHSHYHFHPFGLKFIPPIAVPCMSKHVVKIEDTQAGAGKVWNVFNKIIQ